MLPEAGLRHILDRTTRDLGSSLGGARLFITGGTGFFGKWILASLDPARREFGIHVEATVLKRGGLPIAGFETAAGDVRDFAFPLSTIPSGGMFDIIAASTKQVLEFSERRRHAVAIWLWALLVKGVRNSRRSRARSSTRQLDQDPGEGRARGSRNIEV